MFHYEMEGIQEAPDRIVVTGRTGKNIVINGTYIKKDFTHAGRVFYEKDTSDGSGNCVIRWHTGGIWMFGPGLNYDLKGFAFVKDDQPSPHMVTTPWKVFTDTNFETDE